MQLIAATRTSLSLLLAVSVAGQLVAQERTKADGNDGASILTRETYVRPAAEVERLVLAPRYLNVTLANQSPNRRLFVKVQSDGMPTVQLFGKPWYNLAGFQVDPKANRARVLTTRAGTGLEIIDAVTGRSTPVDVPQGARVAGPRWSPDGTQLAFLANFDDATHIYVAEAATGKSRRITAAPILATLVTEPEWTANGTQIVAVFLPDNRGAEPKPPVIATGPKVRMTKPGAHNRTRTYADLLEWPYERDLVEYYTTGQLASVDVRTRAVKKLGAPAMIQRVDAAPSGNWFHVTVLQKPFSYTVQVSSFGNVEQIWDATGKPVVDLSKRALRETDMNDDDPDAAAARANSDTAKRNIEWLPGSEGIYFLQAEATTPAAEQGEGQPRTRTRDRLFQWNAPFDAPNHKVLLENNNRISEVAFSGDAKTVFVAENANGTAHVFAVDASDPTKRYTLTRVRGLQATLGVIRGGFGGGGAGGRGGRGADSVTFYQNPGTLIAERGTGTPTILTSRDGRFAYLSGIQYYRTFNDSAPQPFLDRIEIRTGTKTRVFTSALDQFEQVSAALDPDFEAAVLTRESSTAVPDSYRRDMKSGTLTKLTNNRDYSPEITNAQRQMFQVTRADGYKFWVTVTLPRDWKPGTKPPGFIWFYPYEYTDQAGYDRSKRTFNRNQFPNLNPLSKVYLITQGYAYIEPDIPIVGEQNRMNDNYVSDLRNNMAAVIDEVDRRGLADRQKMSIGGHSYGAFGTVNAMVHTPFFKAGIAGDGNYNRTLTPNTFQSERRELWEARETYLSMSPILYADRLTGALLMYHNLEDQNVGTDPTNSIRMFHALLGMGKTAALYMYPYEDHGQATRENILDMWARWIAWLDRYVKGAKGDGKIANN
jgi:dipeptidyl aminopeptidase/acylaminoacyl peptidase